MFTFNNVLTLSFTLNILIEEAAAAMRETHKKKMNIVQGYYMSFRRAIPVVLVSFM